MFDLIGSLIAGKYRVTQRLGGGGVADVYEAVHEGIGQRFAIKVLKPEFSAFPDLAERFLVEARAAAAVRHPGVITIVDVGRLDQGAPYLVMELLHGESLADLIERKGRLPQEEAVALCLQLLDALQAAHEKGVIHRDLKPENVFLARGPGGVPWAKLIDFGIARLAQTGPAALRLTTQGMVMGTPLYMAPEQARGLPNIDGRADLYAVGVILFEMLTGKVPFTGNTPEEVLVRVLSEPFPSARALDESIPPALDDVIRRATARRREERFASAAEFAEALRPLQPELVAVQMVADDESGLDEKGTAAREPSKLAQVSEQGPPSEMPPGASMALLAGGGTQAPLRLAPSYSPQPSPAPPTRRPSMGAGPTSSANIVVVRRWAVFLAMTLGVAAVAATSAIALFVLGGVLRTGPDTGADSAGGMRGETVPPVVDRPAGSEESRVGAQGGAIASSGQPQAVGSSATSSEVLEAAAASPVASLEPSQVPARATVRLEGLPPGARATLDGRPVEAVFTVEVSDATHTLRVTQPGRRPFVRQLRITQDLVVPVQLERFRPSASRRQQGDQAAQTPRPLANPFGGE